MRPTAEQILKRLGVASASDIDLEAIAWDLGVVGIKERELDGCEARIVGLGDRAIVSLAVCRVWSSVDATSAELLVVADHAGASRRLILLQL